MNSWNVNKDLSGIKLLDFLKLKLGPQLSARQLKKALDDNSCQVNHRTERFSSFQLGTGDLVTFQNNTKTINSLTFDPNRILFENARLLIYNKPCATTSDNPEFLKIIQRDLPYLALTHRLDRDTTGALIFAKTKSALQMMEELFKKRLVQKSYLAIVDGIPKSSSGTIDNYIGPLRRYQGQTIHGEIPPPTGLHAITEWKCQQRGKKASLIQCFPKTGRTHQIRVHLNSINHPILGDHQYGKQFQCSYQPNRYLLHAESIAFIDPQTENYLHVTAPIPLDFNLAIEELF